MNLAPYLSVQARFRDLQSVLRRLVISYMWKKHQLAHRRRWPDDAIPAAKNGKGNGKLR
jgi:hypothetical protein